MTTKQRRTAKETAEPKQPEDHQPPQNEERPVTEDDFKVDPAILMEMLGVDPRSVQADSVRLSFVSGVAVLEYGIRRAVPTKILGVAMLRAAQQQGEAGDPQG